MYPDEHIIRDPAPYQRWGFLLLLDHFRGLISVVDQPPPFDLILGGDGPTLLTRSVLVLPRPALEDRERTALDITGGF